MTDSSNIAIGDRITFKSATRFSNAKATRVVKDFDHLQRPLVRFGGWDRFIVMHHEIISVEKVSK